MEVAMYGWTILSVFVGSGKAAFLWFCKFYFSEGWTDGGCSVQCAIGGFLLLCKGRMDEREAGHWLT